MAIVTAPNAATNETIAGVDFIDGVGETSDTWALAYFARQGYTIDDPDLDPMPADLTFGTTKDPVDMTVPELVAYATENQIDLDGATKKADILAAIIAAEDEG